MSWEMDANSRPRVSISLSSAIPVEKCQAKKIAEFRKHKFNTSQMPSVSPWSGSTEGTTKP
jgi:Ni,Fe-hydrogenase I large subunit